MWPRWFLPFLTATSAAFLGLGLERVFIGDFDSGDVAMIGCYGAALGWLWTHAIRNGRQ